jgi:hypothetical protein
MSVLQNKQTMINTCGRYRPWIMREHLVKALHRALGRYCKEAAISIQNMEELADEMHDGFWDDVKDLVQRVSASSKFGTTVAAHHVTEAASSMGMKLYGFDDGKDASRVARLHPSEEAALTEGHSASDDDEDASCKSGDSALSSSYSSSSNCSDDSEEVNDDQSDGGLSSVFGEGIYSEVENEQGLGDREIDEAPIEDTDACPYWLPRRLILRLFRDTSSTLHMNCLAISRQALSGLHNLVERILQQHLTRHINIALEYEREATAAALQAKLCERDATIAILTHERDDLQAQLRQAVEAKAFATPQAMRRSKRRLSGDVMTLESQKRKSPRVHNWCKKTIMDLTTPPPKAAASLLH